MISAIKKYTLLTAYAFVLVIGMHSMGRSEVVVFDRVTTVKTPIRIKVLTKSRFFAAGGRLADIYLDGNHLKKILTGGDGYGYLKYTPLRAGFIEVTARSGSDRASGLILVMTSEEQAVVIEIEAGFKDAVFSSEYREGALKALSAIAKKYKIIYLSTFMGGGITGSWLEKHKLPKSVVLRWRGPGMLTALKEKGIKLHAIIGSSAVISAAAEHIERRYTFENTKDGQTVQDWDEILKLLE
jgi:hypothetical protein